MCVLLFGLSDISNLSPFSRDITLKSSESENFTTKQSLLKMTLDLESWHLDYGEADSAEHVLM